MPDYPHLLSVAQRLVSGAGRDVTLVRLGASVPDPSKPWRSVQTPRSSETTVLYRAAFVALKKSIFGMTKTADDLIKKSAATCLIATSDDLTLFQELRDSKDGRAYKVIGAELLAPGPIGLLWLLGLNQ